MRKTLLRILFRLAAGLAAVVVLLLVLLHTGPVESAIWKRIEREAAAAGVELSAAKMDLNLFQLKVTLRDLVVKHPMVEVRLKEVILNGGRGLLSKKIDIDRVALRDGFVKVATPPEEKAPPSSDSPPFTMPPVRLGEAVVQGVALRYGEETTDLNLGFTNFAFNYRDGAFDAGLRTNGFQVSQRQIPELDLKLTGQSADFTRFSNLDLKLTSAAGSSINVDGALEPGFKPKLNYHVNLAEDLLPEAPGLRAEGGLDDTVLTLDLAAAPQAADRTWPLSLKTSLDMAAKPLKAPVAITLEQLAEVQLDLELTEDLTGKVTLNGIPNGVNPMHPLLNTTQIQLEGNFALPQLDPNQLRAQLQLTTKGSPAMDIKAAWSNQTLTFSGDGAPLPGSRVAFSGSYKDRLEARINGVLGDLAALDDLAPIPPELCAGPVSFSGGFTWADGRWALDNLIVDAPAVAWSDQFQDDLLLHIDGSDRALSGRLFTHTLTRDGPTAAFLLDAVDRRWLGMEVQLDPQPRQYKDFNYRVGLRASGEGPLEEPNLSGHLSAHADQIDSPVLDLEAEFSLADRRLILPNLQVMSHHANLSGDVTVLLNEALDWNLDLVLALEENADYERLAGTELPRLDMHIKGGHDGIQAYMDIPRQTYTFQDTGIAVDSRGGSAKVSPDSRSMEGGIPRLEIAGFSLSQIDFKVDQGKDLTVRTEFNLDAPAEFAQTFAGMLPEALDLSELRGHVQLNSDLEFSNPSVELLLDQVVGEFRGAEFQLEQVDAVYVDGLLRLEPISTQFAGVDLKLTQAPYRNTAQPTAISLKLAFEVEENDVEEIRALAGDAWPEGLELYHLDGEAELASDLTFSQPRIDFLIQDLNSVFQENTITVSNMRGRYDDGFWLEPQKINVGNTAVTVTREDQGFLLTAHPTAADIDAWMEGFAGDAVFDLKVHVANKESGLALKGSIVQQSGNLVYLDPWLEMSQWSLAFETDSAMNLIIREGKGVVNDGQVSFSGKTALAEGGESAMDLYVENVNLDMIELQANITSAMEWRTNGTANNLAGTVLLNSSTYTTETRLEDLITTLTGGIPELYFPDPMLEAVSLQLTVLTDKPLIVRAPFAYMEIETPSFVVTGNLAEPQPFAGPLNINKGSSFELDKQAFIFDVGSIQYYPNRPGDPFLQLSMESNDYGRRRPLIINNYLSEMSQSLGGKDMLEIAANFALGKVSSMVSVEGELSETVFDSSFTFVITRPLTTKVIARYAVPLVDQQKNQRFEVTVGPYMDNFVSVTRQNEIHSGKLRHSQKYGYEDGRRPVEIQRVKITSSDGEITRKLRKRFNLKRDGIFSETLWRRAERDMKRYLKERGYLESQMSYTFEDGKLAVDITFGPKTTLEVVGLEVDQKEKRRILGNLRPMDKAGMRFLSVYMERLAVRRGYPSAAAFPRLEDHVLTVEVLLGMPLESVSVTFGDAQALLTDQFKDDEAQKNLLSRYILDDDSVVSLLRARLAAKGYLMTTIGEGYFEDQQHFVIPIDPGPRAKLVRVVVNGEPTTTDALGKPFDYSVLAQTAATLKEGKSDDLYLDIRPRREGNDVFLEVSLFEPEEPVIDSLSVDGAGRISAAKIKRFIDFEPGMELSELVEGQKRLMGAGPYQFARVQNNDRAAILQVAERNRYDVDYELTWDEETQFGGGIQFRDNLLFHDFIRWKMKAEYNSDRTDLLTGIEWKRPWGLPWNVNLNVGWLAQREDPPPYVLVDPFFFADVRTVTTPERREAILDFTHPLTQNQEIRFGYKYQETYIDTLIQVYDGGFVDNIADAFVPEFLIEEELIENRTKSTPVLLGWTLRRFDHPTDPKNGLLLSFSGEYYTEALGTTEGLAGMKLNGKATGLWSRGPFTWLQRYELGWYRLNQSSASRPEDVDGTPFFVLGGSTSVRGYNREFLGPLDATRDLIDNELRLSVRPIGGEAMAFFSHEFNYNTGFYDLGVSPFVDGGFVWSSYKDFLKTDLVVSAGLGLTWSSPLGTLRIDWADAIKDQPFQEQIDQFLILQDEQDLARSRAFTHWSLRFGRVF